MPRENPKFAAVVDLETSGTDERTGQILEVGIILCEHNTAQGEPAFEVVDSRSWVLHAPDWVRENADTFVQKMHDDNGLWGECRWAAQLAQDVEEDAIKWLRKTTGSTNHIALAGSGVAHFDSRWLDLHMPDLRKLFTYWALDVGVMRRLIQYSGTSEKWTFPNDDKPHRALADCELHLQELNAYMDYFRSH